MFIVLNTEHTSGRSKEGLAIQIAKESNREGLGDGLPDLSKITVSTSDTGNSNQSDSWWSHLHDLSRLPFFSKPPPRAKQSVVALLGNGYQ